MTQPTIRGLFASDVSRRIEEVIKVDQTDEQVVREELSEYVVTNSIRAHFTEILESYWETPKKPHEGTAVWISGFFGSGKSSFAKYLGLALQNRSIAGESAGALLARRACDPKVEVLLANIAEHIPTEAVIFDVSTDRGIRRGSQSITEIMYRLFLQALGYARDLDLSELEITLETEGRLDTFKARYREVFGKDWDIEKGKVAIAVQQASRVMHEVEPETFPTADSWRASAMNRADITPGLLAERCAALVERRHPGRTLVFVVDEVGQFVSRDVQKMQDLQAVVQSLGRVGRGRLWLVVTSQEKLSELVGGLDDKRVELARLMDRFPLQVHLEPADIAEVTSKRVLSKNADAERTLRGLFTEHRARLVGNTRLTADVKLPELDGERFIDLYPLLPYQIDLIIQVVSGLRMQGGASRHVGGANRTIIKLAQQLLIHPDVDLASQPLGGLARLDQVYDLVAGNITSEVRGKIDDIGHKVDHPLAQRVAKAICLLQYVRNVHRTAENVTASLHPAVDADSRLPEVKAALAALEKANMVRRGEDGYRIPTPAEDDWAQQRARISAKPGDLARLHAEAVAHHWQPQPSHSFHEVKLFKAGLLINGRDVVAGNLPVHVTLADAGRDFEERREEARRRSQAETKAVFWVVSVDEQLQREAEEIHRSKEMLSRKERNAQTKDETALVAEERITQRRHKDEVRRLLKQAMLAGSIFFRGNDRSPDDTVVEVGRAAAKVLSQALPEVFDRFGEAAARLGKKDLETLMTTENLRGLPKVFTDLELVREEGGKAVFHVEGGPLAEVLAQIANRTQYGETASGRYLTNRFAQEPFGWDFDMVRLLVVSLLRAGRIDATSKGQVLESALAQNARNALSNNNLFRQASFRPKETLEFHHLVEATEYFCEVFGHEIPEIEQSVVARAVREEVDRRADEFNEALATLVQNGLPGVDPLRSALDQMRSIRSGREDQAILAFNGAYRELKEAIRRSFELRQSLSAPKLEGVRRAREVLLDRWAFLRDEADLPDEIREHADQLDDLLRKETFFRELPSIDEHARAIDGEHRRRHEEAVRERAQAYGEAVARLRATPGWEQLSSDQQDRIAAELQSRSAFAGCEGLSIPLLRAHRDGCPALLDKAVEDMLRLLEGSRLVRITASSYFTGGIETEEQLEAALTGLWEQCLEHIGAGKKVLVQ